MKNDIAKQAEAIQKEAWSVIGQTNVIEIWKSIGAEINLVGSLKTGLLVNNRDVDFHIYTKPFSLSASFTAMARLAENHRIVDISYKNLIHSPDHCIEWHAYYEDECQNLWKIDQIHISTNSPFAGYFERVASRISKVLTPEMRNAILAIKYEILPEEKVPSILIYQAVIADGVRKTDEFQDWYKNNQHDDIITWMP